SGAAGPGRDRDDRSGDPVRLLVHRLGAALGGRLGRGVGAQPLGLARQRCRGADPDGPRAACAADLARRLRMSATTPTSSTAPSRGARGFEAVLVIIYGLFALSATARSLVQILRGFDEAPVAYSLSLVAALTYIAVTVLLVRRGRRSSAVFALVMVELGYVLPLQRRDQHVRLLRDHARRLLARPLPLAVAACAAPAGCGDCAPAGGACPARRPRLPWRSRPAATELRCPRTPPGPA